MNVVLIGDVSWAGKYHLGDEAMTEVAITELTRRDIAVTLIAGDPGVSEEFYGVKCVPRFGFRELPRRQAKDARLTAIEEAVQQGRYDDTDALQTVQAIAKADAVVIAGGGNLNSGGVHHIYDRLMLKRLAEHFEIPLYVSSQTVGPHLLPQDRDYVKEILEYAVVVGAREPHTARLLADLSSEIRVVHTADDGVLLTPGVAVAEVKQQLNLPDKYVVASFTYHSWSTGLSVKQYYRAVAQILDSITDQLGLHTVLIPHMGELADPEKLTEDVSGHAQIEAFTKTAKIVNLGMLPAQTLMAVTQGAEFSVSTRYHPVVFGPSLGVPAIGLVTSFYSAVRMRGALANFGSESLAVPFEVWREFFGGRLLETMKFKNPELREHLRAAASRVRGFQSKWWDEIARNIKGEGDAPTEDLSSIAAYEWANYAEQKLITLARISQEATNLDRLNTSLDAKTHKEDVARITSLERQTAQMQQTIDDLRQTLAEVRHRQRPPGADLRDAVRRKIRSWRHKH